MINIKRFLFLSTALILSVFILLFFLPAPPLLSGLFYSKAVYDEHHQLLRLTLSEDGKYRLFVPLDAISPQLIESTLLQEDQFFYWHPGINPVSCIKAGWKSYVSGTRRMGASTITMQTARIRYGLYTKSLRGKLKQIVKAIQLELHYSKKQILEAYLNLAPYGNNIEGAGAASLIYFDKSAEKLNLPEALTLAVIPQNPVKRTLHHGSLKNIRDKFFERWLVNHAQDKKFSALFKLPLQMNGLHDLPFLAPHFVDEVLLNSTEGSHQMVTTLNLSLQKIIEKVMHHYIERKKNVGVNNAAVLIVDVRDMGIKALAGSADFFNPSISGQINGTAIKRSPGSALKPFIYALALEQGLIQPSTLLKDVPHSFGSYNPENFDNDFAGPIKAKDALILSRNIPAIYLAEQLKYPSLYEFLQNAGIRDLKSESYYGLALVLGGAEVSMQELAGLYAALANNGTWRPLQFKPGYFYQGKHLLSPEASYLILDMLKDSPISNVNYSVMQQKTLPVSWKTGTSSGFRDAWTAGVFGPYVMVVWVGNFNNQGNPFFVGKDIAAPLFFEIVNAVHTQTGPLPQLSQYPEQMNLKKVDVCKVSGMLPGRYCTETEKTWFIPGKSPIKTDTIHREIVIDSKTGLRACHFSRDTRFEVYEFWSSDLLKIFKRAGIARRLPPPYDESCTLGSKDKEGEVPQIISPQDEVSYVARLSSLNQTIVPLTAVVDADVKFIYWFLNETFLGKTTRDKVFLWKAKPGRYIVRAVDDYGRADAKNVVVKVES